MMGMNPRKMQQMMKRMGVQQVDVDATEVIIKTADSEIVITNPSVAKVNMMGQETWQITGEANERAISATPEINDEDLKTVMDQTGVDEEKARSTLEKHDGDIAATILELQG
jgi:nascent polypeptide-associated complex subunit alpha